MMMMMHWFRAYVTFAAEVVEKPLFLTCTLPMMFQAGVRAGSAVKRAGSGAGLWWMWCVGSAQSGAAGLTSLPLVHLTGWRWRRWGGCDARLSQVIINYWYEWMMCCNRCRMSVGLLQFCTQLQIWGTFSFTDLVTSHFLFKIQIVHTKWASYKTWWFYMD